MIGRLVRAQTWRVRWVFLSVAMFAVLSVTQSSAFGSRLNMAMCLVMSTSTLTTLGLFWSREMRVLPIKPEAAFRSGWCVAMLLPCAILLGRLTVAAVCALAGWPPRISAEAITLLFLFDAAYVGVSVLISEQRDLEWPKFKSPRLLVASLQLTFALVWTALPFAWPEVVPRAFAEVTPWHVGALVAGVAVAIRSVLSPSGKWPSFGILHDAPRPEGRVQLPPRTTARWLDRLHGLNRLLPAPIAGAAFVAVLSFVVYVAVARVQGDVRSLFDARITDLEFLFVGGVGLLLLAPLGAGSGLTPFLRRLKVLPIGSRRLCLTLTLLPLMTPLVFWMFGGVAHALVWNDSPATWRPGPLLFFCGVMAFGGAIVTRFNSRMASLLVGFTPFMCIMGVPMSLERDQIEFVLALLLPAVGLTGLSAAFFLNYRTLTRSSSHSPAYRQPAIQGARS